MVRSLGDIHCWPPSIAMAGGQVDEAHELHAPCDAMRPKERHNQVFGVGNPELEPRKEGGRL